MTLLTGLWAWVLANKAALLAVGALLVRTELAIAKLTRTTKDDVIGAKISELLAKVTPPAQ